MVRNKLIDLYLRSVGGTDLCVSHVVFQPFHFLSLLMETRLRHVFCLCGIFYLLLMLNLGSLDPLVYVSATYIDVE